MPPPLGETFCHVSGPSGMSGHRGHVHSAVGTVIDAGVPRLEKVLPLPASKNVRSCPDLWINSMITETRNAQTSNERAKSHQFCGPQRQASWRTANPGHILKTEQRHHFTVRKTAPKNEPKKRTQMHFQCTMHPQTLRHPLHPPQQPEID